MSQNCAKSLFTPYFAENDAYNLRMDFVMTANSRFANCKLNGNELQWTPLVVHPVFSKIRTNIDFVSILTHRHLSRFLPNVMWHGLFQLPFDTHGFCSVMIF